VRARRWPRRLAIAVVVLLVLAFVAVVWVNRLQFPYDGPGEKVAAGQEVTIRDPDGACGPLVVSVWEPSILGQWNQTYSGDVSGFAADERAWWQVWQRQTYDTVVPCLPDGETTFTLPHGVGPGKIAVCDASNDCAEIEVG
jgi:hypothetical protein